MIIWILLCLLATASSNLEGACRCVNDSHAVLEQLTASVHEENFYSAGAEEKMLVTIVTYYTDSILSYASFSMFTNYFWTRYANQVDMKYSYSFRIINESFAREMDLIEPFDSRWNKIRILEYMLEVEARNASYVIWLDADLIVIDPSRLNMSSILKLANQQSSNYFNPLAQEGPHVLISRDMATAPFVANTGFIICRNSEWSKWFLRHWWDSFDRSKCCDQHALNWLYNGLDSGLDSASNSLMNQQYQDLRSSTKHEEVDRWSTKHTYIKQRIVILPANVLNSDFPAYKNQLPTDSVLHLAGNSNIVLRVPIFKYAMNVICKSVISEDDARLEAINKLPSQLGINRSFLLTMMLTIPFRQLEVLQQMSESIANRSSNTANNPCRKFDTENSLQESLPVYNISVHCYEQLSEMNEHRNVMFDIFKQEDEIERYRDSNASKTYVLDVKTAAVQRSVNDLRLNLSLIISKSLFDTADGIVANVLSSLSVLSREEFRSALFMSLEILKEAFGSAVEYILLLGKVQTSNDCHVIHTQIAEWIDVVDHLDGLFTRVLQPFSYYVPKKYVPKSIYYKFKQKQLLASATSNILELKVRYNESCVDANRSCDGGLTNKDSYVSALTEIEHLSLQGKIVGYLIEGGELWEVMSKEHAYYGADYIMADPQKEGSEVYEELGQRIYHMCRWYRQHASSIEQLEQKQYLKMYNVSLISNMCNDSFSSSSSIRIENHTFWNHYLLKSINLKHEILRGYDELHIATTDIVMKEHLGLIDTYMTLIEWNVNPPALEFDVEPGVEGLSNGSEDNSCSTIHAYLMNSKMVIDETLLRYPALLKKQIGTNMDDVDHNYHNLKLQDMLLRFDKGLLRYRSICNAARSKPTALELNSMENSYGTDSHVPAANRTKTIKYRRKKRRT